MKFQLDDITVNVPNEANLTIPQLVKIIDYGCITICPGSVYLINIKIKNPLIAREVIYTFNDGSYVSTTLDKIMRSDQK